MMKIDDTLTSGIAKLRGKFPDISKKLLSKIGVQLLSWTIQGSPQCAATPPKKDGILRGSGSVFIGSTKVMDSRSFGENGTPNESINEPDEGTLTIGFNTAYAYKMHEMLIGPFNTGGTLQQGELSSTIAGVSGKFLEAHLNADMPILMKVYADDFLKEAEKYI